MGVLTVYTLGQRPVFAIEQALLPDDIAHDNTSQYVGEGEIYCNSELLEHRACGLYRTERLVREQSNPQIVTQVGTAGSKKENEEPPSPFFPTQLSTDQNLAASTHHGSPYRPHRRLHRFLRALTLQ